MQVAAEAQVAQPVALAKARREPYLRNENSSLGLLPA